MRSTSVWPRASLSLSSAPRVAANWQGTLKGWVHNPLGMRSNGGRREDIWLMVRPERFELPTYCSGGNRSIQLSYGRAAFSLHGRALVINWTRVHGALIGRTLIG